MRLVKLAGCSGGTCPAIYRADDGSIVVKGDIVSDAQTIAEARPTTGETLVRIPVEVLASLTLKP